MSEVAGHAWWIRVSSKPRDRWYAAAFQFADAAEGAVRVKLAIAEDIIVRAHGEVRPQEIAKLALKPGEIRKYG